jgi:hypothetical protein
VGSELTGYGFKYGVKITQGKSTAWSLWSCRKEAKSYIKYARKEWVKAWKEFPKLKTVKYHAVLLALGG